MNRYVVGFLFDDNMTQVCMIKKSRPVWQNGLLNGIGGKIDERETPLEAMIREFREETGVDTTARTWSHVCTLRFPYAEIEVYAGKNSEYFEVADTNTDEEIVKQSMSEVLFWRRAPTVENVSMLIELSRQRLTDREGVAPGKDADLYESEINQICDVAGVHKGHIATRVRELSGLYESASAVANEYNQLIRHMDAGGDFHEFMAKHQHKGD